jgi:hypothetical protein
VNPGLPAALLHNRDATREVAMPEFQKAHPLQSTRGSGIPGSTSKEKINLWAQEFLVTVAAHPTARRSWEKLCKAGLDGPALYFLSKYAHADSEVERIRKDADRMAKQVRDTMRALQIANSGRKPKRAKDSILFLRRALEHLRKLDQSWQGGESPLSLHMEVSKRVNRNLSLRLLERHFKQIASKRGPLRSEVWLRKLQEFADSGGVHLGLKLLVELATCANPDMELNHGSLSRVFRYLNAGKWTMLTK